MASLIVIAKQIHANMVLRHAVATIKADYVTVVISRFLVSTGHSGGSRHVKREVLATLISI